MWGAVCPRAVAPGVVAAILVSAAFIAPASAEQATFKAGYYNVRSGTGRAGLYGTPTFTENSNCTDPSQPLNAWGAGLVQQHLAAVADDPEAIVLGLGEAWNCASPERVRAALGWKAKSSERNGVAMVARYGFAGPEEWTQLDTSLNTNPADTKWVLRRNVCLDAGCARTIPVFVAHWYGTGSYGRTTYERQAQQTADFLRQGGGAAPHILLGDLNVWEGSARACNQNPNNTALGPLRAAGYVDAWPMVNGSAEGYTGMANRSGCGTPNGHAWKRIDYIWSPASFPAIAMTRFAVVAAGADSPSDHYGILATFPVPGSTAPVDTTAPLVTLTSPGPAVVAPGTSLVIDVAATDDVGVTRVEILENGAVAHTLTQAPFQVTCEVATEVPGTTTLAARAFDAAGNIGTSASVEITVEEPARPAPLPVTDGEIVLHVKDAPVVTGAWQRVAHSSAASGAYLWIPDAGRPKLTAAFAAPEDYFELTFEAEAGVPYRLWMRGRAERDYWGNDSAFFQFSGAVTAAGAPAFRIGTTSATWAGVEDCSGCVLSGWGWNDNGYGGSGALIYFEAAGQQTVRVQRREDGLGIDQIVLSPSVYIGVAPGAPFDDTTILGATTVPPATPDAMEIQITASSLKTLAGGWQLLADSTAAEGTAVGHPDAGAAQLTSALADPAHYVEFTFTPKAGVAYRLWLRGRADRDHWANDSVFVQFDKSLDANDRAVARIGTTDSYSVNLEEAPNYGVAGWGWQDNGYGEGVLGPLVVFETDGPQTIRIQTREDGFRIDQIVLSSALYLDAAPGAATNDAMILK